MSRPENLSLPLADVERIAAALQKWITRHPTPDRPLFPARGKTYSAREIADGVSDRAQGRPSEVGDAYLRMLSLGINAGEMTVDGYIESIDRSATDTELQ